MWEEFPLDHILGGKTMKRGKKYQEAAKLIEAGKAYDAKEALDLAIKTSIVKFDASVDVAFRLNIDPRKAEQNIRGAIVLPNGTGKTQRVLVLCRGAKQEEAKAAGADYVEIKPILLNLCDIFVFTNIISSSSFSFFLLSSTA